MALNVYEGMFLLDSTRFSRDPDRTAEQVVKLIEDAGGEILVSRFWEEKRLAYPIKGHRKGVYWLTYFKLDSLALVELNRQCTLFDANLRHMFIKIDPRMVESLVEHAKAGPRVPQAEEGAPVQPAEEEFDNVEMEAIGDVGGDE